MAEETIASIIALHQPKRGKTAAQRARTYRPRKRQRAKAAPDAESPSSESLIPAGFFSANTAFTESPVTPLPLVTSRALRPSNRVASILLMAAAFALATVGVTTNGWFARSLGSSDIAGWLFLAIGVAADLAALVMPSCAAGLWHTRQRCVGDDFCFCRYGGHWLRVSQHDRCCDCAGRACNARGDSCSIGIERRHVCAGSGVHARARQVLPRARSRGR